jgi:Flp pilus assembly pilin Flp
LAKAGAWLGRRRCVEVLRRLHRDERGDMLEYAMVFAFVVVPTMFLFERLFEILSDYFSMIAFFVTWPFL